MTVKTQSQCLGCRKQLHNRSARKHLNTCIAKAGATAPKPMLLVSATASYGHTKNVYVLYTLMPKNATLRDIDEFLKEHWLECCGHLSTFDSKQALFVSDGFEDGFAGGTNPSFDHRAAWAIPPDSDAHYEYDMGSTTCVSIRVQPAPDGAQDWLAQHGIDAGDPILQNLMPESCDDCGQEATHFREDKTLCAGCFPESRQSFAELPAGKPQTCDHCENTATHHHSQHMACEGCRQHSHDHYRDLVNSPRDGTSCFDTRTPAEEREFEENYTIVGYDPTTGTSFFAPKKTVAEYGQAQLMAQLAN